MSNPTQSKRFFVSDLGFGFAVYDTQAEGEYNFVAGKDKEHKSSNKLNSRRLDVFATEDEAVRYALELERKAADS